MHTYYVYAVCVFCIPAKHIHTHTWKLKRKSLCYTHIHTLKSKVMFVFFFTKLLSKTALYIHIYIFVYTYSYLYSHTQTHRCASIDTNRKKKTSELQGHDHNNLLLYLMSQTFDTFQLCKFLTINRIHLFMFLTWLQFSLQFFKVMLNGWSLQSFPCPRKIV